MDESLDKQRLDKWLWAARFFKTRALAAEAVSGGKVHLNGVRVKPSREIKVGDQLKITRSQLEYVLLVQALNSKRRPAKEAALLYDETPQSIEIRMRRMSEISMLKSQMPFADKRPSKKDRRQIVQFKRKQND